MKRTIKLTGRSFEQNYVIKSIKEATAEGVEHIVEIKPYTKDRKLSQNRLQHHWFNEIHRQAHKIESIKGWSLDDIRAHNKLEHGVPIMCEDPEFSDTWQVATGHLNYEYKKKVALLMPVTSLMTVKQMARYLTEVHTEWTQQGAILTTSDDLYYEAMGV